MPIKRDEWFDDEGNMDFEEVQEDLSFAADMIGLQQRAQTNKYLAEQNRLLRAEQAERRRIQAGTGRIDEFSMPTNRATVIAEIRRWASRAARKLSSELDKAIAGR